MSIQQLLLKSYGGNPIQATGGTKSTPGDGYVYHQFTSSGSFVVTSGAGEIKYVVIGGGGGGGSDILRKFFQQRRKTHNNSYRKSLITIR